LLQPKLFENLTFPIKIQFYNTLYKLKHDKNHKIAKKTQNLTFLLKFQVRQVMRPATFAQQQLQRFKFSKNQNRN